MRLHRMLRCFVIPASLLATLATPARAQWQVDGGPVCTAENLQTNPRIVSDGAGGALIAWQDLRGGSAYDIYAQHVLASGALDPAWPVNGRALCMAANEQGGARIATDGAGGAIVTWIDSRAVFQRDIYAQHVLGTGTVDGLWPVDGVAACTAANPRFDLTMVTDGSGGAIITWVDSRAPFERDIYAQRVLTSGMVDPLWPVDGRPVCTAAGQQAIPQIVTDGSGGAIVAWHDLRGADYDIYAQRVLASGAVDPAWPADGTALCTAADYQTTVQIVADGNGGVIATWQDSRSGSSVDVYAQHALATGVVDPAWPVDGASLCQAINSQAAPRVVGDGASGAIVTWHDSRGESSDIYASRVYASGGVADVPAPRAAVGLRLLAPYPSPSRGGPVTIAFELPSPAHASAQVFDAAGHRVRSLMLDRELPAGRQSLRWDGRNEQLQRVPAGVYFVRIRAGGGVAGRQVVVLE